MRRRDDAGIAGYRAHFRWAARRSMSAFDATDPIRVRASLVSVPRADIAVLAVLWLAYLWPFAEALPFIDGVRDLQIALDIARGEAFPLVGPVFGNRFHLGPVFHYLLALPLLFGLPLSTLPIFLGALAGAKFALAYGFGREWIDRRYGLLFAAALALPGWSGLDFLNTTTPMLVPVLLLASCWCALRFVRAGRGSALLGCALSASLALHAHPAAAAVAVVPVFLCLQQLVRERRWGLAAAAVGVALLPLLPALLAVVQSGSGAVLSQAPTVTVPGSGHSLGGWIDAVRGFALGGPLTTLRTLGSADCGAALAWITLTASLSGLAMLAARATHDRRARGLGVLLLGVGIVVFAARSNTPWYFVQALTLAHAAALAYGWHYWQVGARAWVSVAIALAWAQAALVQTHLARGEGNFASIELMDVRRANGERGPDLPPWISIRHWQALADLLCADPTRMLALHAALARAVDDQGGLAARAHCNVGHVRLGGAGARHLVGLPRAVWSQLQWSPEFKVGSIGVFTPTTVVTSASHAIADPQRYPLRAALAGEEVAEALAFETSGDALLVVSQLSPALAHWRVDAVRADGVAIQPLYVDSSLHAYRVVGADNIHWRLRVSASSPGWVDIVTIAPQHSPP